MQTQHAAEIAIHQELAAKYVERYSSGFAEVYSRYWNEQFLRHLPERSELILDCGCGTGDLLRELLQRSERVVDLDISEAMLEQGRLKLGAERAAWVAAVGEALPFQSGKFDAVCFRGALHHMADEAAALRQAWRVLKPGGRLVLSEPNADSLVLRLPRLIANWRMRRFSNDHKSFHSWPWLALIESVGFRIEATKYFSYLSQPLCGMSDVLPLMRLLPGAEHIAAALVRCDELCSRLPLVQRQSFDFIVAARKE